MWSRSRAGDTRARDELVAGYLWLAKKLAHAQRIPDHVEREELISWASGGLLDAVTRFDPETSDGQLHKHFMSYASMRIRGAILDGLKSPTVSWASRAAWRRQKERNQAEEALAQEFGRPATTREIAARMGVKPEELETFQQMIPIGATTVEGDEGAGGFDAIAGGDATDQEGEFGGMADRLAGAFASLPADMAPIAYDLFFQGHTLTQAARAHGLQTSRVRKIRTDVITHVRVYLQTI